MYSFFSRHQTVLGVFSLIILALIPRVANIFHRGPLWLDELFTYYFAQLPLSTLSLPLQYETNPPLSFLIPRLTVHGLALTDIFWLRFPSLIFSLGAVYLTYRLGRILFSSRVGLLAALMLSFSGVHIMISGELRIYAWFTLLTLTAIGLFILLVQREHPVSRRWWIFFTLVHLLLLYSHLTAIVIILGEVLVFIVTHPDREVARRYLFSLSVAGLGFVPWLLFSIFHKFSGIGSGAWYFATHGDLFTQLATPFAPMTAGIFPKIIVCIIILGSLVWHLLNLRQQKRPYEIITVIVMGMFPLITSSLLGVFVPKYVVFAYPFLYLMVAACVIALIETHSRYVLLPIGIFILMLPTTWRSTHHIVSDWYAGRNYLEERVHPQDRIIADLNSAFSLYAYTDLDRHITPILLTEDDFLTALVKNNWHNITVTDTELREWLNAHVPSDRRASIHLAYTDTSISRVAALLEDAGWEKTDHYQVPGAFPVLIDTYYVPNHP